jgi:hypothetical protein
MIVVKYGDLPSGGVSRLAPKHRECLRCQVKFHSEWAGERICPRCKGKSAWREGAPVRRHSASRHR